MSQPDKEIITDDLIVQCTASFRRFVEFSNPYAYGDVMHFFEPTHKYRWADIWQKYRKVAMLSPRGSLKSTIAYDYLAWRIMRAQDRDEKWMYISYKEDFAKDHLKEVKKAIKKNPLMGEIHDLSKGSSTINYTWDGEHKFTVKPVGMNAFKRGWHGDGVICDDILQDAENDVAPKIVHKITRIFFRDIWYFPAKYGWLYVVGTPVHKNDLFFKIQDEPSVAYYRFKAIMDDLKRTVLWPEMWTYKELDAERKNRPRIFNQERQCEPSWDSATFIERDRLLPQFKNKLQSLLRISGHPDQGNLTLWPAKGLSQLIGSKHDFAGYDVGKKAHPSHFYVGMENKKDHIDIIFDEWLDHWDYTIQAQLISQVSNLLQIDLLYYDNTRAELEGYAEQGDLPSCAEPLHMTAKLNAACASKVEEFVNGKKIRFIPNSRTFNQILAVNNDLVAYATDEGHGDSFWTTGLLIKAFEDLTTYQDDVRVG